jgi:uncharacterized protein YjbK
MRPRFKVNRLCSSDNYELSKKIHREDIVKSHNENQAIINEIITTTHVKQAYISVFGKLMPITEEEVIKIQNSYTIIYK